MDYILLGIHCSKLGYRDLRFAAGDNLIRMPYLGPKFSSLGAFPIYRDRVMSRKYILGLCEDVAAMLDNGDNVIVFPEGGRSYSGAMLKMKAGLIAANIIAQFRSPQRRHYYLPFTVSYEVLPEIGYLSCLEKGRRLRRGKHGLLTRAAGSFFYWGADLTALAGVAPVGRVRHPLRQRVPRLRGTFRDRLRRRHRGSLCAGREDCPRRAQGRNEASG